MTNWLCTAVLSHTCTVTHFITYQCGMTSRWKQEQGGKKSEAKRLFHSWGPASRHSLHTHSSLTCFINTTMGAFSCTCSAEMEILKRSTSVLGFCNTELLCLLKVQPINEVSSYQCLNLICSDKLHPLLCNWLIQVHVLFWLADVNECNKGNGGCDHNCTNSMGSYHCSCYGGYILSGHHRCLGKSSLLKLAGSHGNCLIVCRWLCIANIYF